VRIVVNALQKAGMTDVANELQSDVSQNDDDEFSNLYQAIHSDYDQDQENVEVPNDLDLFD
jgi:hypothetical protein